MDFNNKMKPETIARRKAEFLASRKQTILNLHAKLIAKYEEAKNKDADYAVLMYLEPANEMKQRHQEYFID